MHKQTLVVAGLAVNVFSLRDPEEGKEAEAEGTAGAENSKKPVAVLFLLHGRTSRADHMELVAKAILDEVQARRKAAGGAAQEKHDLWVVTFVSGLEYRW